MAGSFDVSEDRKGRLFEHLVFNQLQSSAWSKDLNLKLSNFRSRGGLEVDFLLDLDGKRFALELKANSAIETQELSALLTLKRDYEPKITCLGVHMGKKSQKINGVWCHPWQIVLKELGL